MKTNQSNTKIFCFAFSMALFSLFGVQAQEKLTLKTAIDYALEHKADAQRAALKVENSAYQIQEVRARALPKINVSGSLMYNPLLRENALPGELIGQPGETLLVSFGTEWAAVGTVQLSQTLFDYSVFTGLKAAKTTREFYRINQQLTKEQIIEAVAKSYYQYFITVQKFETINQTLENTEKIQNTIQGLFENGLARKVDLDRIKVTLVNLKSSKKQLENAVQLQENALKFLIGMKINTPIVLEEKTITVRPISQQVPNVEELTQYQLLKSQKQLLVYNKESYKSGYYPTLSLVANYSYQGLGDQFPLSSAKPADGVFWTDYASVGLNLSIPIFNGFGTRAKVRQAQNQLEMVAVDMEETKLALHFAYENAQTQINNSIITINNQKENVKLAQEVLEDTQNNYRNGLASLTDLLEAENALTQAKNNYSNALLEYKVAQIELIKSQGKLETLTQ